MSIWGLTYERRREHDLLAVNPADIYSVVFFAPDKRLPCLQQRTYLKPSIYLSSNKVVRKDDVSPCVDLTPVS